MGAVSPGCLLSRGIGYFVDCAIVAGNPTRQGISDGDEPTTGQDTEKEAAHLLLAHEWHTAMDKKNRKPQAAQRLRLCNDQVGSDGPHNNQDNIIRSR